MEQVVAALDSGASKASVCRSFKVPRSTLLNTLARVGWTGPAATASGHGASTLGPFSKKVAKLASAASDVLGST